MLNLPTQEPAVRGGVGSCSLDQRSRTAAVQPSPPVPFCSDTQGAHGYPWNHMARKQDPRGFQSLCLAGRMG